MLERRKSLLISGYTMFVSGYTVDVVDEHGVLNLGIHCIRKPCNIQELATKIQLVL